MSTPIGYITLTRNDDERRYVDIKVDDIVAISGAHSGTNVCVGSLDTYVNVTQSYGEVEAMVDEAKRRVVDPDRDNDYLDDRDRMLMSLSKIITGSDNIDMMWILQHEDVVRNRLWEMKKFRADVNAALHYVPDAVKEIKRLMEKQVLASNMAKELEETLQDIRRGLEDREDRKEEKDE